MLVLCTARAMGELWAVSVVSGHIRGKTNTLPLHVEILYNEYNFQAAFAVASLLAFLALVTLVAKSVVEWRAAADRGRVRFEGQAATVRDVRRRGVGFVFQHYALFRHMSVFENVAFGLRVRPWRQRPSRRSEEHTSELQPLAY